MTLLIWFPDWERASGCPPETALAERLQVSRTTARKVLIALGQRGIVTGSGRQRAIVSSHGGGPAFPGTSAKY